MSENKDCNLNQFFETTRGIFTTDLAKAIDTELINDREQTKNKGKTENTDQGNQGSKTKTKQ